LAVGEALGDFHRLLCVLVGEQVPELTTTGAGEQPQAASPRRILGHPVVLRQFAKQSIGRSQR
jgi:hypothetical protein